MNHKSQVDDSTNIAVKTAWNCQEKESDIDGNMATQRNEEQQKL